MTIHGLSSKNMYNKLISICIPTYNGEKTISKTLDAMIFNIEKNKGIDEKIEIVINDDCSSDNTFDIITRYADKYEYIKIFKNEKNLGMDGNFKKVALSAVGEYIWFSGQDDIFLDGVVEHVLDSINNNPELGIIYINYSQYSEKKEKYVCESMFHRQAIQQEKINFNQDLLFNDAKEYFSFFNDVPSFLPATIMKKNFWLQTNNDEYSGTCFIQYATILLNINKTKILAVTRPLIKGLVPTIGWQTNGNKLFSIHLGAIKAITMVFNDSRNPFPEQIYLEKKWFYLKHFLRVTIASRYYRFKLSEENRKDLEFVYGKKLCYFYFLPIVFIVKITPHPFINFLFFIKKHISL